MGAIIDPKEVLMTAILSMDVYGRDPENTLPEVSSKLQSDQLGNAELASSECDSKTLFGATA